MIRSIIFLFFALMFSAAATAAGSSATGDRLLTISYGDVSTDFEDTGTDASGWRVNLSYETGQKGSSVLHGVVLGYIETTADVAAVGSQTTHYKLKTLPIYYAPKFLFGKKAFKGFVKGALGLHFSDYKRSGALGDVSAGDTGFYGGASLGAMLYFNEKLFANVEYEWAYLGNSYYRDGEVQSAMIGLGSRF